MPYLYSTLSNSLNITEYSTPKNGTPRKVRSVLVKGGTNVSDKHLITPQGVVTEVTQDELEFLKAHKTFNRMVERGFIKYEEKKADVEKVVADMVGRDESAPLVPEDFAEDAKGAKPAETSKRKGKKAE